MGCLAGNCGQSASIFINPAPREINTQQIVKLAKFAMSGDLLIA